MYCFQKFKSCNVLNNVLNKYITKIIIYKTFLSILHHYLYINDSLKNFAILLIPEKGNNDKKNINWLDRQD